MGMIANSLRPNGTCSLGMGVCVFYERRVQLCRVWVVRGSVREVEYCLLVSPIIVPLVVFTFAECSSSSSSWSTRILTIITVFFFQCSCSAIT